MKIRIFILLIMICLMSCTKEREEVINDPPSIFEFYGDINKVGGNLTIIGANFSRHNENNLIEFGGGVITNPYSWKHGTSANLDTLDVIIPEGAETGKITIEVYSKKVVSTELLYLFKGEFTKMASIPVERTEAVAFSINGKGYVCTGGNSFDTVDSELNDVWEYDSSADKWTQKNDFLGRARRQAFSFVIDGKAYVGGGRWKLGDYLKDFYCYDPESDTWTELADFPGWQSANATTFSINNRGYVIGGISSNLVHEYNPMTDEWLSKVKTPIIINAASSFVINNTGYVVLASYLLEYNSELDTWSYKEGLPVNMGNYGVGFTTGGLGYIVNTSKEHSLNYSYDQLTDEWVRELDFPGVSIGGACSFVIDDKPYIVGGGSDAYPDSNECWRLQKK